MLVVHVALPARICKSGHPVQQVRIAAPLQQQWSGTVLGSLFSGLSNCSVNILPQNFLVNVKPPSVPYAPDVGGCFGWHCD